MLLYLITAIAAGVALVLSIVLLAVHIRRERLLEAEAPIVDGLARYERLRSAYLAGDEEATERARAELESYVAELERNVSNDAGHENDTRTRDFVAHASAVAAAVSSGSEPPLDSEMKLWELAG